MFAYLSLVVWPMFLFFRLKDKKINAALLFGLLIFLFANFEILSGKRTVIHDSHSVAIWMTEMKSVLASSDWNHIFSLLHMWIPYEQGGTWIAPYLNPFVYAMALFDYLDPFFKLSEGALVNISILHQIIGFAVGMVLLLSIWTQNRLTYVFCFFLVLFSNAIVSSMLQSFQNMLFFFPYSLFLAHVYLSRPSWRTAAGFGLFFSLAVTSYVPSPFLYAFGTYWVSYLLIFGVKKISHLWMTPSKLGAHFLIVSFAFACISAPYFFQIYQVQNNVVPSRAFSEGSYKTNIDVKEPIISGHDLQLTDLQSIFFRKSERIPFLSHHAWYFCGALGAIFFLMAIGYFFMQNKKKGFLLMFLVPYFTLLLVSFGKSIYPLFFVLSKVPVLNLLRHYLFVYNFAFVFFILISAFGFQLWMENSRDSKTLFALIAPAAAVGIQLVFGGLIDKVFILSLLFVFLCTFAVLFKLRVAALVPLLVLLAIPFDLLEYQYTHLLFYARPYHSYDAKPFAAPTTRRCVSVKDPRISGTWTLVHKEACIVHAKQYNTTSYPTRYQALLSRIYPEHGRVDWLTRDLSPLFESKREAIMGVDFPIYFYVSQAEVVSKECQRDLQCRNGKIDKMIAHYHERNPSKVFLFGDDELPALVPSNTVDRLSFLGLQIEPDSTTYRVEGSVNAPADGYIVRLENFHKDWRAFLDGVQVPIYRGNYAFQVVPVKKGVHRIVFEIKNIFPWLFLLHQACFIIAIAMLVWLVYRFFPKTMALSWEVS